MQKLLLLSITFLIMAALNSGCAEVKSAGKTIGHATKDAATDIGHGTRRVVKEITSDDGE